MQNTTETPPPAPPAGTPPAADPVQQLAVRGCDVPAALADMLTLADQLAQAGAMVPGHLRRQPANLLAVMFAAKSLDVPLWTAIQAMHLVDGKVGLEATFQRALVNRAGHRFRVIERTDERAVVGITRHDAAGHEDTAEYTWAEAQTAGLARKDNWQHYRRAMLVARATVIAVREITPEVLFGAAHTPDELGVVTDEAGTPVTVVPSVRVDTGPPDEPAGPVRDPEEAEGLRELYRVAVATADTPDQLRDVWRDARRDGVTDAPLHDDGTTVGQALTLRAAELLAAEDAAEPHGDPDDEPVDGEVVGHAPGTAVARWDHQA